MRADGPGLAAVATAAGIGELTSHRHLRARGGSVKGTGWVVVAAAACLVGSACSRGANSSTKASTTAPPSTLATAASTTPPNECSTPLEATDIGVTPTDITIEVMADVGSPLAPGLFQGNFDAINAFARYVNEHGGIACRKLIVRTWDSKLDPTESKNGQIDACQHAFALVGTNALFNPDATPMNGCVDKNGQPTGLPDLPAIAADVNEQCGSTVFYIQGLPQKCPITPGPRAVTVAVGPVRWQVQQEAGLHGLFLVPGDLPTTIQGEVPTIAAYQQVGLVWDATPKVSGFDSQTAYTPRVQLAKSKGSTLVYNGSNDVAMVRMRKEADAQGLTSVKIWGCSVNCYTKAFLAEGGADVEGTYISLNFLPFEEASYNTEDDNYVNAVGLSNAVSWGAEAWQAAVAFQTAADAVVARSGPNGLTRESLLQSLKGLTSFTANGWTGTPPPEPPNTINPCFMIMQVRGGRFVRLYPAKPGTMDCSPSNLLTVTIDPVAAAAALK